MRWERLFDDLEAQMARDDAFEREAEVADRTRRERALVDLQARLLFNVARGVVSFRLSAAIVSGPVLDVGPDWVLVEGAAGRAVLIPLAAVRSMSGLAPGAAEASLVAKRFTLGAALRAVSRDRAVVEVVDVDGNPIMGTIDAVGCDHVDLAEHASDEPRRARNVVRHHVVPFAAMSVVRRI